MIAPLLAAGVLAASGTLLSDLPDDVLASVAPRRSAPPPELLEAIRLAAKPYAFDAQGVGVLTDRRWFSVRSVEGPGAPALELRRWPGDTVLALYLAPAGPSPAELLPGLALSGDPVRAGSCTVRDGRLTVGPLVRTVVWAECALEERRVTALGVPGDAGLGPLASAGLKEEILGVLRQVRPVGTTGAPPAAALALPDLPSPPKASDERRDAWQSFQGDGFTLGLPPGMRAIRLDLSVPPPRPMPEAAVWLRGQFTDRDGTSVTVGDARRAGYVTTFDASSEEWRAGVAPPLGAAHAEKLDEAELHDLVLDWTRASKAVVSHWKEPGFAGDWLVFRLAFPAAGVEIGLPVVSGWRSLALFWIPTTWRGAGRPPAPPPIDPAGGLGVKFDRLDRAERSRQKLVEGTLVVAALRVEIPRSYWPVANLASPDGLPVTLYDPAGLPAGRIESIDGEAAKAQLASGTWAVDPRPGARKAASIHTRADGTCLVIARGGGGYLLVPEAGGKDRADAWRRLIESASIVKAARRDAGSAPGRSDD